MADNQEREQKIVSSFMTEAIRLVPDLKAVFAEEVDDGDSKILRLCLRLPADIGIMSDSSYKLQELADSFSEKAEQRMHLTFTQVRHGGELIVLDLSDDLKVDDSETIDLSNFEIEKRIDKDLPANVMPRHPHLLLQLGLAAISLIVLFFFWTNAAPPEDTVTVVYAIRDVKKGTVYTESDLKEKRVEFSKVPISFMSAATHGVGKKAPRNIHKDQILSELDVDPLPDEIKDRLKEPPPPGSGVSGSNAKDILNQSSEWSK